MEKGARLPIESELADRFHVSRATIREAMKYLSAEGIVLVQQGRGTFVNKHNGISRRSARHRIHRKAHAAGPAAGKRVCCWKPQIAMSAAQRATEKDIKILRSLVEKLDTVDINNAEATEIDIAFHESIARCTHNVILSRIVPSICESVKTDAAIADR